MERLFIDDFVKNEGFSTTEDYIDQFLEEDKPPYFNSLEYFDSLSSEGLIVEGLIIRTSDNGIIDRTYVVDNNLNLVGITSGPYPADEVGPFKPKEILTGKRISAGWTIENVMRFSNVWRNYRQKNL